LSAGKRTGPGLHISIQARGARQAASSRPDTRPHLITCPNEPKIPLASKGASTHRAVRSHHKQRHWCGHQCDRNAVEQWSSWRPDQPAEDLEARDVRSSRPKLAQGSNASSPPHKLRKTWF